MNSLYLKWLLGSFLMLLIACNHQSGDKHDHRHSQGDKKEDLPQEQHRHDHQHGGKHQHHHSHANKHMNQSSFEDLVKRFESPERDAYQQPEKVLDYIGDVAGQSILDIGAGTGYFSFKLADRGAKVIAGDVDDRFQNFIQRKMDKENASKVTLRKLPYDSPALKTQEVDKVLIVNTYHHIEKRVPYFQEVLQGLKEKGELIVIDFKKREGPGPPLAMKMSADFIVKELRKAGFENIKVNTHLLEHQYIIRAK